MVANWAFKRGHVDAPPTWRIGDLTLPKAHEKPPFQSWERIESRIASGGLTPKQVAALWECLYLDEQQVAECVGYVRERARYPFVYPMIAFAAFTGARRSEILRSERHDWDFENGTVAIRQKKSDNSKTFTLRHVPIHDTLAEAMKAWFKVHPAGQWSICTEDGEPISERMGTKYFRQAVRGGKWTVLHGFHVFRHSLASIMASKGVDQRIINDILGHSTEDMERRYRHLFPAAKQQTMKTLFC
jgi:integrase